VGKPGDNMFDCLNISEAHQFTNPSIENSQWFLKPVLEEVKRKDVLNKSNRAAKKLVGFS
jgi:hypothetical protein